MRELVNYGEKITNRFFSMKSKLILLMGPDMKRPRYAGYVSSSLTLCD